MICGELSLYALRLSVFRKMIEADQSGTVQKNFWRLSLRKWKD